jgi:hypothetical protein
MADEFGVKVSIVADSSSQDRFQKSVQKLANQVKNITIPSVVVNSKTKTAQETFRASVQALANTIPEGRITINTVSVRHIDCDAAIRNLRLQLEEMLSTLSVNGLQTIFNDSSNTNSSSRGTSSYSSTNAASVGGVTTSRTSQTLAESERSVLRNYLSTLNSIQKNYPTGLASSNINEDLRNKFEAQYSELYTQISELLNSSSEYFQEFNEEIRSQITKLNSEVSQYNTYSSGLTKQDKKFTNIASIVNGTSTTQDTQYVTNELKQNLAPAIDDITKKIETLKARENTGAVSTEQDIAELSASISQLEERLSVAIQMKKELETNSSGYGFVNEYGDISNSKGLQTYVSSIEKQLNSVDKLSNNKKIFLTENDKNNLEAYKQKLLQIKTIMSTGGNFSNSSFLNAEAFKTFESDVNSFVVSFQQNLRASETSVQTFSRQVTKYMNANPRAATRYAAQFADIQTTLSSSTGVLEKDMKSAKETFSTIQAEVEGTGLAGQSRLKTLAKNYIKYGSWSLITQSLSAVVRTIKDMINSVTELDSALTQLKIVSGETDSAIESFANKAIKAAETVGASATDIVNSAETWARLGYTLDESLDLSSVTAKLSTVADIEVDDATTSLTSILKAYSLDAGDAEQVADILTLVGEKYAISASELGEALQNGGASLEAANNTLEQSVAIMAAGNAAVKSLAA